MGEFNATGVTVTAGPARQGTQDLSVANEAMSHAGPQPLAPACALTVHN